MKKIIILGSTGSIGVSTLDIVRSYPDEFVVTGLVVKSNVSAMLEQINEFNPQSVSVVDHDVRKQCVVPDNVVMYSSPEQLIHNTEADIVVAGISGSAGLSPTLEAIRNGRDIALANKEVLVMAGSLVLQEAQKNNVTLLPVDSEHNAIYQCLKSRNIDEIKRIIITASGGPFYFNQDKVLHEVTPEQALQHPRWQMGDKVTIDSATLINKGFEVIEAHYLFNIPVHNIEVVIHPESILHGMIEFVDNAILALLYNPDMRIPIQHILGLPKRLQSSVMSVDFTNAALHFEKPDMSRLPGLQLCYDAAKEGGTMTTVLNAADEVCVFEFLKKNITFTDIVPIIKTVMNQHSVIPVPCMQDIIDVHKWAQSKTYELCTTRSL